MMQFLAGAFKPAARADAREWGDVARTAASPHGTSTNAANRLLVELVPTGGPRYVAVNPNGITDIPWAAKPFHTAPARGDGNPRNLALKEERPGNGLWADALFWTRTTRRFDATNNNKKRTIFFL